MTHMDLERLIKTYVEIIWNQEEFDRIREFVHEDYRTIGFNGNSVHGPDQLIAEIKATKDDLNGLQVNIMETITDGTRIVAFVEGLAMKDGRMTKVIEAADLWIIKDNKIYDCPRVVIAGI